MLKDIPNRILLVCIICWLMGVPVFSQVQTLEVNRGFLSITEIMKRSCTLCHEWAVSREGLADPVRYTTHKPEQSPLYTTVVDGSMPPMKPKLNEVEKELVYLWILAGAPISDTPLTRSPPAIQAPEQEKAQVEEKPRTYFGFSSKVKFHQVSGFTSGSLLLAAGEFLYLANAVTGIGMLSKDQPGLTSQDLQVRIKDIYG